MARFEWSGGVVSMMQAGCGAFMICVKRSAARAFALPLNSLRWLNAACIIAASLFLTIAFLRLHASIAPSEAPDMEFLRSSALAPTQAMGWWAWWDQGLYVRAAVSWANGVTDPMFHWYLPGYPLLGAPFVFLTPADPFFLPNLACLLASLWLFCGLADRLMAEWSFRIPAACGLFVASVGLAPLAMRSWVVPWTTTPETTCIFAALLGAMQLIEGGGPRAAFLTGAAITAIAGFRPGDAAVAAIAIGAAVGPALFSPHQRRTALLAAGLGGALLPVLVFGGAYLATWGTTKSIYIDLSSRIGFELGLLPLRWVTLVIDPRPLFSEGHGLAETFVWIVPGAMGMVATVATARRQTFGFHLVVLAMLAGDFIMYLTYRDLHLSGLWRYGNYHYFKWTLPIFALYAFRLLPLILGWTGQHRRAIISASIAFALLFCWRVKLVPLMELPAVDEAFTLVAPHGLNPLDAVLLVPGHSPGEPAVMNTGAVTAGGITLRFGLDYVIYDAVGLMCVIPLRSLPQEPTIIHFAEGTLFQRDRAPSLARQTISWGLPW